MSKTKLENYVRAVSKILGIQPPKIITSPEAMETKTMLAKWEPETNIIYLKNETINYDLLFCIAHELRHVWQFRTNRLLYFSNYSRSGTVNNIELYNLQPAELDAHAFATRIMIDNFGVKPQFNSFSPELKGKIYEAADKLPPCYQIE